MARLTRVKIARWRAPIVESSQCWERIMDRIAHVSGRLPGRLLPSRLLSSWLLPSHLLPSRLLPGLICLLLCWAGAAQALPSFARQTGQPCTGCHVGGYGPQLTPFGREFKLRGYTMQGGNTSALPVSAMLVTTYTHTSAAQSEPAGPHDGSNNNASLQELSLFAAGRLSSHVGMFVQATYSDIDRHLALDNVEFRFAQPFSRGAHSGVWGISANNSPGLSDLRHTQGVWRFPFMGSELAPSPEAAPLIDEGLAGQVVGAEAYASLDAKWYGSFGLYDTMSPGFRSNINADDGARLDGLAPYWRLTRQLPHNIRYARPRAPVSPWDAFRAVASRCVVSRDADSLSSRSALELTRSACARSARLHMLTTIPPSC